LEGLSILADFFSLASNLSFRQKWLAIWAEFVASSESDAAAILSEISQSLVLVNVTVFYLQDAHSQNGKLPSFRRAMPECPRK
jgi:hypothetical protein